MLAKLALLILVGAFTAAALLTVRQQRMQAVHEMAEAAERALAFDRQLWRVRAAIARRQTPGSIHEWARRLGPPRPMRLPWCGPGAENAGLTPAPPAGGGAPRVPANPQATPGRPAEPTPRAVALLRGEP